MALAVLIVIYTSPMNQWARASTLSLEPTGPEKLSPEAYLRDAHRAWPGCAEGDFDYVDGYVVRHDWGITLTPRCIRISWTTSAGKSPR